MSSYTKDPRTGLASEGRLAGSHLAEQPGLAAPRITDGLLALEPRFMFDAAGVATGAEVATEAVAQAQAELALAGEVDHSAAPAPAASDTELLEALAAHELPAGGRREVLFVDAGVADYASLVAGIDPSIQIHVLSGDKDGVTQIADALAGLTDIDAVHIVSHGDVSELHLGNTVLDATSMDGGHAGALAAIGEALAEDADLLVYGCNFGQGEAGRAATEMLSSLTGADVASSNDDTGQAARGGDWQLEQATGAIESHVVVSDLSQQRWEGLLTASVVSTSTAVDANTSVGGPGVFSTLR